ncbi:MULTISPECIES: aldose epimerase family protein [Streptomyces]|uniref:aldose epimerase family protein n=1 Tax=Streptomyces TaxID=1883 RepID=UPI0006F69EE3|nr:MULTISPECIES: aldose epimerase family protein [unclassified Streptomyces]KQX91627.1 aldose epimerase [Streptomyces sp. Root1319]KQZ20187.1 aldose epimerase [Streptomyces sp. Root55]RPK72624.1 Aldose 1-epimerase precursor [Streptomyces sp. ADI97-07]
MPRPTVHRTPFGSAHGTETGLWTLDSGTGVRAEVLTYGASLHRLTVPDTAGSAASVVRSLATIDDYTGKHPYFGAVVGRYANRIAHGRFSLDGATHHIPANDRGHALHGGPEGFHTKIWDATSDTTDSTASVRLTLHSPDGDMGFPGALDVSVTYTLDTAGTLAVDYASVTDRATVVNLTNHAYFELAGHGDVLGHLLEVDADTYLPVDGDGIPAGPPAAVRGTAFDLTAARVLGERTALEDEQLRLAGGFDHCWVLREPAGAPAGGLRRAARLTAPDEGRVLEVWTTEPGIQVYTANQLDGSFTDGDGRSHDRHGAVCLETQHLPDSPNRPGQPSTVLRPGETARSRTELRFPHLER